jgi:hypothetical protein
MRTAWEGAKLSAARSGKSAIPLHRYTAGFEGFQRVYIQFESAPSPVVALLSGAAPIVGDAAKKELGELVKLAIMFQVTPV